MSTSPSQRSSSPDTASTMTGNVNEDDAQQFQQIIRDRRCKFSYCLFLKKISHVS
jgi:hypothetical protein